MMDIERRRPLTFTAGRLAILVPYSIALWALAWAVIRFRGPQGAFSGKGQLAIYGYTLLLTFPINWLHLKLANLPRTEIVNAVALTLACATTIDAVCMGFFPQVYGVPPELLRKGAAWILWAGAIACFFAFLTRMRATDQGVVSSVSD